MLLTSFLAFVKSLQLEPVWLELIFHNPEQFRFQLLISEMCWRLSVKADIDKLRLKRQ